MPDRETDPFSRWSARRKAVAEAERAEAEVAATAEVPEPPSEPIEDTRTEAEILEDLGLPDPDTLDDEAAFKGFMDNAVPAAIRKRALRRLWRLNPVLANVDGLVDYGDDFTDAAMVVPDLKTAYEVGKGILRKIAPEDDGETDGETLAADAGDGAVSTDPEADHASDPAGPDVASDAHAEPSEAPGPAVSAPPSEAETDPAPIRPRRMSFRFRDDPASRA